MDVIEFRVLAEPGKPVAIGHIGTIVLGTTNSDGETPVTLTISRKGARRVRAGRRGALDTRDKRRQNTGDN